MLRLVVALALGASTQAFVVAPQHKLSLTALVRAKFTSPVGIRDEVSLSNDRPRRGYAVPPRNRRNSSNNGDNVVSMRVGRSRGEHGNVEIEGAGGEIRRVQRRTRRRRLEMESAREIGAQAAAAAAAAAVVVQQEEGVDVQTEAQAEVEGTEYEHLSENFQTMESLRERAMMEEQQSGTIQDKYTQIYVPADGIIIKKTYGFWTWQVFGLIFIQHFVRNIIRKGGSLKKTSMSELNWDHIVTEPEHLLELKAYCCEECGYTLFPARGRHEVFFDEVEDFRCPECDAPRSAFYDANDKNDPHNIKRNEALEENTKAADEGENAEGDGAGKGDVVASVAAAGGASSAEGVKNPSASSSAVAPPASEIPEQAPPESSSEGSAAAMGKADPSPADEGREKGDSGGDDGSDGDDLLDF